MENKWETMSISRIKTEVEALNEEARLLACAELMNDPRKGVVAFAQKTLRAHERVVHERARLEKLWRFENEAYAQGYRAIVGTDEVGRGPLAGPVVAAAVVLPRGVEILGINDSKNSAKNDGKRLLRRSK